MTICDVVVRDHLAGALRAGRLGQRDERDRNERGDEQPLHAVRSAVTGHQGQARTCAKLGRIFRSSPGCSSPLPMKLGLQLGYWGAQPNPFAVSLAQEAERLGFDSVWTGEAWGSDAFTPLAWIGAHTERIRLCTGVVQISARTPAVDRDARAHARPSVERSLHARPRRLSGPQVVEGWYGQPFGKPLARTREYVDDRAPGAAPRRNRSRSRASTTAARTTAPGRGGSASRCARSRIRCAPTCRSCSAPKARRTSRSRPRSPTAGSRSTTRRSGPRCTPTRSARPKPGFEIVRDASWAARSPTTSKPG